MSFGAGDAANPPSLGPYGGAREEPSRDTERATGDGALDRAVERELGVAHGVSPTDPLLRQLAMVVADGSTGETPHVAADSVALQIVRRISAGGNGRVGHVRLQLGEGDSENGSVEVTSDADGISVTLRGSLHASPNELAQRIRARLARRGLTVANVTWE